MAFSDSKVYTNNTCLKTCLKSYETLKKQYHDLRIEFNKSEFNLATYKRGLVSVEEQLVFCKKNEVIFCEQIAVLKRDISYNDSEISMLKRSQIPDNIKKGLGYESYHAVLPPPTRLFSTPKLDLSNSGLEKFQQTEFESYGPKTSKSVSENISNEVMESPDALLGKELVSNDKLEKKTGFPTAVKKEFVRPNQQEKPVRKPVKYAEMYRTQGKLTTVIDVNAVEGAFLEKPTESEGFEQIIHFLNANPIKYALTVNLTIYTLCIKQFWAMEKVKTVNGGEQIQALVDKKKVIITETSVRSDLHLEDAKGTEWQPNATIFEQLTLMGAKTTAWNKFTSNMASAIISLATNKKFNFSKYIFDHMVKNLEDEHETTTFNDPLLSEVVAKKKVSIADLVPTTGEVVTTAGVEISTAALKKKSLIDIKTSKPKAKDAAELEEEERLARQKEEEANIALIESWDNTQAMMDADYELAARLQEEQREELTIE
nr:xylulose kinase-1 [Tanacetum cinerariifolium]